MTAIFGTMEVHVAVVEWNSENEVDVLLAPTEIEVRLAVRESIVDTFNLTVPDFNPDGVRAFVLGEEDSTSGVRTSKLTDEEWLAELRERTTVPWVTLSTHTIEIQ